MPKFELFFLGSAKEPSAAFEEGFKPPRESKDAFTFHDAMNPLRNDGIAVSETFESATFTPEPTLSNLAGPQTEGMDTRTSYVYLVAVDTESDELDYFNMHHETLSESTLEHLFHLYLTNLLRHHMIKRIPKEHVLAAYTIDRNINFTKVDANPDASILHLDFLSFTVQAVHQDLTALHTGELSKIPGLIEKCTEKHNRIFDILGATQSSHFARAAIFQLIDLLRMVYFVLKKNNMTLPRELQADDFSPYSSITSYSTPHTLFNSTPKTIHHMPSLFDQITEGKYDDEINRDKARLVNMLDDYFCNEITKRGIRHIRDEMDDKCREFGLVKTMKLLGISNKDDEPENVTLYAEPDEDAPSMRM